MSNKTKYLISSEKENELLSNKFAEDFAEFMEKNDLKINSTSKSIQNKTTQHKSTQYKSSKTTQAKSNQAKFNQAKFNQAKSVQDQTANTTNNLTNDLNNLNLLNDQKALIYARCSTIKQTLDANTSLETQVMLGLEYCANYNFNVVNIIKEVCSGHDMTKLSINDIPNNYSNINIIIADPSRMSRNVSDADLFLKKCDEKNIVVHFARDNLRSNILNERRNIVGLIHDAYSETQIMSKRIKSSINLRKRKGSFIGNPSFGQKAEKIMKSESSLPIRKLINDNNEQKIMQIIKDLYYGTNNITMIELFIRELGSDKKFKIKWLDNSKINKIYFGNITSRMIANLLNDNNILKRGRCWSPDSVLSVINNLNIKQNEINYDTNYLKKKNNMYKNCSHGMFDDV